MTCDDQLEAEFTDLWREVGAHGHAEWQFDLLKGRYSARPRAYHTLTHVRWGLRRVSEIAVAEKLGPEAALRVLWAMWFHDAEMDFSGQGTLDESRSAELSGQVARAAGLPDDFRMATYRLIMATAHMHQPELLDEQVLVDADLSMLGASEPDFDNYERLVRQEWSHVPNETFRSGRLAVLQRFVDKPRIFTTAYGFERWERRARENLSRSMAALKACATLEVKVPGS